MCLRRSTRRREEMLPQPHDLAPAETSGETCTMQVARSYVFGFDIAMRTKNGIFECYNCSFHAAEAHTAISPKTRPVVSRSLHTKVMPKSTE